MSMRPQIIGESALEASDDQSKSPSPELIGKWIREACADRSGPTTLALQALTRLLAMDGADVNYPNRNGKRAVHFAAQLRSDVDVLALLVEAKADINASTHRGHTPLIYAAGRRRLNVVEFLLARGSDAATWTVQGVCAVAMARNKGLPAELIDRLEANQNASSNPRYFKDDNRAILAQQEHSRQYRTQYDRRHTAPEALEEQVGELAIQLGEAAAESTEALTAALLEGESTCLRAWPLSQAPP